MRYINIFDGGIIHCFSDLAGFDFFIWIDGFFDSKLNRIDVNQAAAIVDKALSDWVDGNDEGKGYIELVKSRLQCVGIGCTAYPKEEEE